MKWLVAIIRPRLNQFKDHQGRTRGCISTWRSSLDRRINIKGEVVHDRGLWSPRDRGPIAAWSWSDRRAIVAQSSRDRGSIKMKSWPRSPWIERPRSVCDCVHQIDLSLDQTVLDFRAKSPLKTDVSHLVFLNSWLNPKENKWFKRNILSPSWSPHVSTWFWSKSEWDWSRIPSNFIGFSPSTPNVYEEEIKPNLLQSEWIESHSCGNRVSSEIRLIIKW